MQQPQQMMPMMPSFPASNVTTEQIQKCLDDNKKLILAILDNQNLGKLAECAQYQAQLQRNLMYLAAIADAQPQAPTMPQMAAHGGIQQGPYYMQHPQAAMSQQGGMFSGKVPFQSANPLHVQEAMLLHQQAIQGQLGMRPMMQSLYSDGPKDGRLGPKHDSTDADCRGNSAPGDSNAEWK